MQLLAEQIVHAIAEHGVTGNIVHVIDFAVAPGVEVNMGDGDQWPLIRRSILNADILAFCTSTWMSTMSSVAQRVLERLDAAFSVSDPQYHAPAGVDDGQALDSAESGTWLTWDTRRGSRQ